MAQTRRRSALEAAANTLAGFGLAAAANAALLPLWGCRPSPADSLGIAAAFTAVSLARGFALRRLFNAWDGRTS